jgi:adenine-specific DNA-methyltransferase
LEQSEDHLTFAAATDEGEPFDPETASRLMTFPGTVSPLLLDAGPGTRQGPLAVQIADQRDAIERGIFERNARFFEAEAQKPLEAERNRKRRSLFDAQDELDRQREALIDAIEGKLTQRTHLGTLLTIRWSLHAQGNDGRNQLQD